MQMYRHEAINFIGEIFIEKLAGLVQAYRFLLQTIAGVKFEIPHDMC